MLQQFYLTKDIQRNFLNQIDSAARCFAIVKMNCKLR